MIPLDIKNSAHYREQCLKHAMREDGNNEPDKVVAAAAKYFAFLSLGLTTAAPTTATDLFPTPSGMPDNEPLPSETITTPYAEEMSNDELRLTRRRLLFELDVVSGVMKLRSMVPA